ncbi:MAG: M20/M25/M40 family metallo-hydrolase [Myxococcota bacterium]
MNRHKGLLVLLIGILGCGSPEPPATVQVDAPPPAPALSDLSAERLLEDVRWLAAEERQGRLPGSRGGQATVEYIQRRFESLGLQPGFGGSYAQEFDVELGIELQPELIALRVGTEELQYEEDFVIARGSSSGEVVGQPVPAGFGIVAAGIPHDDYAGLDVDGRIVIVTDGPAYGEDSALPNFESHPYKARLAAERGARALIIVAEDLPDPSVGWQRFGIPAVVVLRSALERSTDAAGIPEVALRVAAPPRIVRAANVAGWLPGQDAGLRSEAVVVGAHHDHLGHGDYGSRDDAQVIHPGADDNASGVATVLEIARVLKQQHRNRRGILFITFDAEELGLLGSHHFLQQHEESPSLGSHHRVRVVAMVNADMVGRLRRNRLFTITRRSSTAWAELIIKASAGLDVRPIGRRLRRGGTDSDAFVARGIPAVGLFTGTHADYHRGTDTIARINDRGLHQVATFGARIALMTANASAAPPFVVMDRPDLYRRAPFSSGVWLGFALDPGRTRDPKVRRVLPHSPADRAGVEIDDVLRELNGVPIHTKLDYFEALENLEPGERYPLIVRRRAEDQELQIIAAPRN